jgi:gliding motility-associated-like protein
MRKSFFLLILSIATLWLSGYAQLCNGSLGDPVAWINFGQGVDIGLPLPPSVTNYTFTNSVCPDDGFYTITRNTSGCFGNSWHSLPEDHTPNDINGKFMLVNASNAPGVFYLDTVRGLCGGTTYEFSAYVANVLRPNSCSQAGIDPNLTFTIEKTDGTVLIDYNSGDINETNSPVWIQYGTFFQTPSNVSSVVLRIRNNAPGGCGNDLALDDITFSPCGPKIEASFAINNQSFVSSCVYNTQPHLMQATYTNGYANPQFQWQLSTDKGQTWSNIPGAITTSYLSNVTLPGTYQYRLLIGDGPNINNPVCRIASKPVVIQINDIPKIDAIDSLFPCTSTTANLRASGGGQYLWNGPNGFTSNVANPSITNIDFNQAGIYEVIVTSDSGCINRDSTHMIVRPAVNLAVSADQSICEGNSVQLSASGGDTYKWEPIQGLNNPLISNPVASPDTSINYTVFAFNNAGCSDTGLVLVTVWQKPLANAGPDLWTTNGVPVQLQGSAEGSDISVKWSPANNISNTDSLRPFVTLTANGFLQEFIYRLDIISNPGCGSSSDLMTLTVFESFKVPNTFTPNGDGYNDIWEIQLLRVFTNAIVEVYNTTGSLVYRSVGYNQPWDGKRNGQALPAGTYYYTIDLKSQQVKKLAGYVTIFK